MLSHLWRLTAVTGGILALQAPAALFANDITPNEAQGLGSIINSNGQGDYTITGGTVSGQKLLHGFESFNIPTGGSASFDGTTTAAPIQSIFGIVSTGRSDLQGALNVINFNRDHGGTMPELFLMNANGFLLGPSFSTNLQQLNLMAVDGLILGCRIGTSGCSSADQYPANGIFRGCEAGSGSCDGSNQVPLLSIEPRILLSANTHKSEIVGSFDWSISDSLAGAISNVSFEKFINIQSIGFTISELRLAGSLIAFQPGSEMSIKELQVISQWFDGAWLGELGSLAIGYFRPVRSDNSDISLDPGDWTISHEFGSFIGSSKVGLVNPMESNTMQLQDFVSTHIPIFQLAMEIGDVAFGGAIKAAPYPYQSPSANSLRFHEQQAHILTLARRASIYPVAGPLGYTSPFGLNARVIRNIELSKDGLHYGFGARIEIDPTIHSDLYVKDLFPSFDQDFNDWLADYWATQSLLGDNEVNRSSDDESARLQGGSGRNQTSAAPPHSVVVPSPQAAINFVDGEQSATANTAAAFGLKEVEALTPQRSQQILQSAIDAVKTRGVYNPAILQLRFTEAPGRTSQPETDALLDLTLIPTNGAITGRRVEISSSSFVAQLKQLYSQLSRQEDLDTTNPNAATRRLYDLLIGPLRDELERFQVTTLLIGADRGLQAIPYAALHSGHDFVGERFAFSLTPSLSLTNLSVAPVEGTRLLAAGASRFDGLAPLPLVPQELEGIASADRKDELLDAAFTPAAFARTSADPRYQRIHLATHAEFLPGGPSKSQLYSGAGPIPLSTLANIRQQRRGAFLDLIALSACRTALGDSDTELGFAGLALQAGARSAIGTLWYVDDVATSAFFIQVYRYLEQGLPKAEALQATRRDFSGGRVKISGNQLIANEGQVLLTGLTKEQQRRVGRGLTNPYYWSGIELLGAPW